MALLTLVYVFATIILAILALVANHISSKQLKTTILLEKERSRPYLVFDLFIEDHFVHAIIKNIGQTEARGVTIEITPTLHEVQLIFGPFCVLVY